MAYAALPTVVAGAVVTEAWGNQVKANFDAGPNALVTSAGDLVVGTGAGALARLARGGASQRLRVNAAGTALEWAAALDAGAVQDSHVAAGAGIALSKLAAMAGCGAYNDADWSIPNGVATALTFNQESYDTDAFHSPSTNPSRLTTPRQGFLVLVAQVRWAGNASGQRLLQIRYNGSQVLAEQRIQAESVDHTTPPLVLMGQAYGAQYYEVLVTQTSGGSLTLYGSGPYSYFQAMLFG
ncbi:MAG TPA: hypothetical protein VG370_34975 [Chloroflexota bacterium]|jgi:hypothetical protein|nr:hypothetical protein [Chloroflexota bacterium]